MNISKNDISGNCKLKCAYNFNYHVSSCKVNGSNSNYTFSIDYDKSKVPPVTYNGNKYNVQSVDIVRDLPALKIRNQIPLAYIMIEHQPIIDGNPLYVYIPIIIGTSTQAGGLITKIIKDSIKMKPNGGNMTLNIPNFTLNTIVPSKPFFATSIPGTNKELIVYDFDYAIAIEDSVMNDLYNAFSKKKLNEEQLNKKYKTIKSLEPLSPKKPVYYNSWGANSLKTDSPNSGSDDIYIECNPVNQSQEEEAVKMPGYKPGLFGGKLDISKYLTKDKIKKLIKNPWVQAVLVIIAILVLFFIIVLVLKYIKPKLSMLSTQETKFGKMIGNETFSGNTKK